MNDLSVSIEDQNFFLNNLRTNTAQSHKQLEENEISTALLSPEVTIAIYQEYISRMYGIIAGCENKVFPALTSIFPDLSQRQKSSLIINDLYTTGFQQSEIDQLQVCDFDFSTVGEALGIMYVLEGSTLGGRVLYKHIQKTLDLDESEGVSFFCGYGSETGSMWKRFINNLSHYAITNNCEQEVISGAAQTFTVIDGWLSHGKSPQKSRVE